ncbi:MAG TPA: hypothetical protein PKC55_10415 [Dysgonomonas sp.]|nr:MULTISPECIES: hypothetical protein [unclassified Dysgonomonas]HML65233.1 hypothetical protein [Dysgonomonas sp.]
MKNLKLNKVQKGKNPEQTSLPVTRYPIKGPEVICRQADSVSPC